uniref:Uncharacterized protein n=1 Tax=Branchiostoma floridae TaxID=7739 RepID=C3YJP3_BRAFL|eukprot:XP_002603339.1 hypothetical protein BRAFLDRAFT_71369 [Branchiostoma floridae]
MAEGSVRRQASSDGDPCSQCYSMHPCTKVSSLKSCRQCYSLNPCDQACSRIYGRRDGDDLTAKCGAESCTQCYSLNPCDQACSLIYRRRGSHDQTAKTVSEARSGQDNSISPVEHRDEDHKGFLETNSEEQEVKETLDETKTASSNSKDRPLNLKGCNADIVVTVLRQENELLRRRTNSQHPNIVDVASDNETIESYIISYMCPNLTHEEAECHSSMRQNNAQKNCAHPTNSENVTQPQNPEIGAQPQNPENGAQPQNPENFLVSNPLYVPRIPKQAANGLTCRHMNVVASVAILCAMLITCCLFIGLYINTNIHNSQKALADSGGFGDTRLTSTSGNMQEATMSAISNSSQESRGMAGSIVNSKKKITFGGKGKGPGKFKGFTRVVVSRYNEIFVADGGNSRIQVFGMNGTFLRLFPAVVPGVTAKTMYPTDVTIDGKGNVWVVGFVVDSKRREKCVLVKYNREGQPALNSANLLPCTYKYLVSATFDAVNNKVIVAADTDIYIFSPDDSLYDRRFKSLKLARCVTSDKEGNIITAEGVGVHVYNHTGHLLFRILWKAKGMGTDYPQGVYRDSLGNIIIGSVAHRVDMYRYNGTYVRTVVEVRLPWDIAVGPDGQLVVTTRKTKNPIVTIFPRHTLFP